MNNANVPAQRADQLPDHINRMQDLLGGINNIANSIAEAGGVASGIPFIGINGEGNWAYGQDRIQVEAGSHWAIDIRTWQHGYIAWPPPTSKDRKPLAERMVPASSSLPVLSSLPQVPVEYQLQFAFQLLCMSGEDTGVVALYKNGSHGAKAAIQTMVDEVRKQAKTDPTKLCPVVELHIRDYIHPEWKKKIYNPVLHILKWISFEEFDAFEKVGGGPVLEEIEAPVEEVAPVRASRPASRPVPTPAPAPQPAGRRRPATRTQPNA